MRDQKMKIIFCGLSMTSSWGNGHATTYRGLVRELTRRGHEVWFLECDKPWYAHHRDFAEPPYGKIKLYLTVEEFKDRFSRDIREADAVIVGSYVPNGIEIGQWVIENVRGGITVFYDIDTPVTLANLFRGQCEYLIPLLIPFYDLYLSFTGGPVLQKIEGDLKSPCARALYCSVDTENYYKESKNKRWSLGYLGTYSEDRQKTLFQLLVQPAHILTHQRFVVAGPQYPHHVNWGENVDRIEHIPPAKHRDFYNSMHFTLNVTRRDMIEVGYSPSVRLFEAAACGTPIISDYWEGLSCFFEIGQEILVAQSKEDTLHYLTSISEEERQEIGLRAQRRVITQHSAQKRAAELETYLIQAREAKARRNIVFHEGSVS